MKHHKEEHHHHHHKKHHKEHHSEHGKHGLKMPMGNAHWEEHPGDVMVENGKYASEMGAARELKDQVDGLANYAKKHQMKY